MGAFFLAATSMFVSCKDYDDDINANTKQIQNVESTLKAQITELNSALQQEKTAAAAAHSAYEDAVKKAQAAADAANASLQDALLAAATHATTSYVDDAVNKGTADKATVTQLNDAINNLQTTLTAAIDGKASKAELNSAISAVNDKIAALNGDIAAATNAQNTLSATLTAAIDAVDKKADLKANQSALDAAVDKLNTALAGVQQSMQTKADVQEAIAAATANLATNASVAEKIQAAADAAKADVNLAKAELQAYADKAATAAATEAAATAKAEAIAEAIKSANNLEEKLTTMINQLAKDASAADAQLQKNLNDSVAVLVAKIGGINTNLSSLIDINKNAIAKNLAAIENINLQIDALNRFTGLLEDKNVVSLKDSLRLTYAELQAAKQTLGDELVRIETKVDLNALAYAAALLVQKQELTARIDSLRDNYATAEELENAEATLTLLIAGVDDRIDELIDGDITTLKNKVKKIEDNIGEASIAAMLKDIADINKTIEVSALGKIENLDLILEDLQGQIDDLDDALAEYKEANDARVKKIEDAGFISETAIDGKIATAVAGINTELGKYVQQAEIDKFLTGTKVVAALQTAGFALTSDLDAYVQTTVLNTKLEDYLLKSGLTTEAIEKLNFIVKDDVQAIADAARDEAQEAAQTDLQKAINDYDTQLADALNALFNQITKEVKPGDDGDAAIELPTAAKEAIEALQEKFEENQGVSPAVAYEIDVLWISLDGKLTSLVFYPESYYGGIESIEITALKIENIYGLVDTASTVAGTWQETFKEIGQKTREYDLFPNGYAKYHINPVNADLTDYTLAFIDHTANTRSAANPYLKPVYTAAKDNKRDANDILWVEFKNSNEIYNEINKASGVPSMGHNAPDVDYETGYSHYVYGNGTPGKGIVTALTAHKDTSYVASDYALIVPVTINSLVLANTKFDDENDRFETSNLKTDGYTEDNTKYNCDAAKKFHLHRKVLQRIADDNAINRLRFDEQFDLTRLVETHFVSNSSGSDDLVDADLFRRLNLAYRFQEIDYDTEAKEHYGDQNWNWDHHYTSESRFITLTGKDTVTINGEQKVYFNGVGYFNQVKANAKTNGEKIPGKNAFGDYKVANEACIGRQPVVRVELYRKDKPDYIYAIGYLKLEISDNVDKDTETFSLSYGGDLLATCDPIACDNPDYGVVIRWDEIQEQLNDLIKDSEGNAKGMRPAAWNTYEICGEKVKGEDGEYYTIPDQYVYDNVTDKIIKIDQNYDEDTYPYYKFGTISKIDDKDYTTQASGVWTDVLAWTFCEDDWKSLYFDATVREFIDANGVITEPIKRYVKLTSEDSANPDLFVGIEIQANKIHFPAGIIGRVKGAYWYEAATAVSNGKKDMILNVDMNVKTAHEAEASDMVENGWFYKNILKNFDGEAIKVDLSNAIATLGDDEDLKELAAEVWEASENYYVDSKFYFRMPSTDKNNKESVVYNNGVPGEWTVKGISGNLYTLMVTDLVEMCEETETVNGTPSQETKTLYWPYGESVSIVKINGKAITAEDDQAEEIEVGDEKVWGYKFLTVNATDAKGKTHDNEVSIKIVSANAENQVDQNGDVVGDVVAGYAQDMLNYARHSWSAENTVEGTDRPYNLQLTAYMLLMPTNYGATIEQPGQMLPVDPENPSSTDDSNTEGKCYILPGYNQKSKCTYCYDEIETSCLKKYKGCFAPVINEDNLFTVRFLQPVFIGQKLGETEVTDALLASEVQPKIEYSKFLELFDWAEYFPGNVANNNKSLKNFIEYYGVKLALPEKATEAYWEKYNEVVTAIAAGEVEAPAGIDDFIDKVSAAADALDQDDPADKDYTTTPPYPSQDIWKLYYEAKKAEGASSADGTYPTPTKTSKYAGIAYTLSGKNITDKWDPENEDMPDGTEADDQLDGSTTPTLTNYQAFRDYVEAYDEEKEKVLDAVRPDFDEFVATKVKDADGNDTEEFVYAQAPKAYDVATGKAGATDLTVDPTYAEQQNGSGVTYQKTQPKASNFATDAEYEDAIKAYQAYQADKAAWDAYYGTKPVSGKIENVDNSVGYTKRTDGKNYLKTTFAAAGDNQKDYYGVQNSTYKSYFDAVDAAAEAIALRNTQPYIEYKALRDAYRALAGTGEEYKNSENATMLALANAYYFNTEYDDESAGDAKKAVDDFIDMMEDNFLSEEAIVAAEAAVAAGSEAVTGVSKAYTYEEDEDGNLLTGNDHYFGTIITRYYQAVALAEAGAETVDPSEGYKYVFLTDLTNPEATPTTLDELKARIKTAKPIAEKAPKDLKFKLGALTNITVDATGAINGSVPFEYNNNNDVNGQFHIYVPFEVTYNYLDRAPATPVTVWAIVTIKTTTGR